MIFDKIKINHEMPLELMLDPRFDDLTDYSYDLVHMNDEIPEYKKYFQDSLAKGRQVLLDNSVFELDEPFNPEKFVEKINELKPTWYVVPDFLDDCDATIRSMDEWISVYLPKVVEGPKIIGSIQGKTPADMIRCYQKMASDPHVAKIAITFNSECYAALCPDLMQEGEKVDMLQVWCEGRQRFISKLVMDGIWENNKPHHLLGCAYMRELSYPLYHRISIETLDTSNPVVCGIKGIKYDEKLGNLEKPSVRLYTMIHDKLTDEQKDLIEYNIRTFRKIVNNE